VGGAHAGFELVNCGVVTLERQQPRGQHLRLVLGLQPEQVEQRDLGEIPGAHATLRFTL
jgi:hypothetical protein